MSLYLSKLESKLDNALSKETRESLTEWIGFKRNKPQTKRTMKNIYVLPTDKPSRLIIYSTLLNEFRLLDAPIDDWKHKRIIYITSDEEIKKDDWFLDIISNTIHQAKQGTGVFNTRKKIILTTDQDLIKDGVQPIDDEFLEWFIKNPNCKEVYINKEYKQINQDNPITRGSTALVFSHYEIIIPQQEPIIKNN